MSFSIISTFKTIFEHALSLARVSFACPLCYNLRVICKGQDNLEIWRMKILMKNSAENLNFGASTRWKIEEGLGLNAEDFENWLWRRKRQTIAIYNWHCCRRFSDFMKKKREMRTIREAISLRLKVIGYWFCRRFYAVGKVAEVRSEPFGQSESRGTYLGGGLQCI